MFSAGISELNTEYILRLSYILTRSVLERLQDPLWDWRDLALRRTGDWNYCLLRGGAYARDMPRKSCANVGKEWKIYRNLIEISAT